MNIVQNLMKQKLNPSKNNSFQTMAPSEAVGSLIKIGEFCIKNDDSCSKQFLRMNLFHDSTFH